MRTTVTLDSDVEQILQTRMQREGISFKQALNDAVRAGAHLAAGARVDFVTQAVSLGVPGVDLDRALQVASELEDAELMARLRGGS